MPNEESMKNFKHFCRRLYVVKFLIGDLGTKNPNIPNNLQMCSQAYDKVTEVTIMKCFHKMEIIQKETESVNVLVNFNEINLSWLSIIGKVSNLIHQYCIRTLPNDSSILYVNVSQNIAMSDEASVSDIIAQMTENN